jgi:putative tryptophan/tyrosine transport system substrate-binding protein
MATHMRRREFIFTLGGAAAAWPLAAVGQQPATPVIGFLSLGSPDPKAASRTAFQQGLADAGYVLGQNAAIEFRFANNQPSLLPRLASDLADRKVAVIVATGSPYAALAAKAATSTIPIVFAVAEDPVRYGLVTSLSRPGGTATGMTFLSAELVGKRLNLLLELLPKATTIAYLSGPSISPIFEDRKSEILAAARAVAREIIVVEVRGFDFEAAFATLVEQGADALIVGNFSFFFNPLRNRDQILELAARHKIITIYPNRMYVAHGGLMSYDSDSMAVVRQLGSHYVGRILKGAKPADLPVQQPIKFELAINLKTATALGLTVPEKLLALADEVIE